MLLIIKNKMINMCIFLLHHTSYLFHIFCFSSRNLLVFSDIIYSLLLIIMGLKLEGFRISRNCPRWLFFDQSVIA
jgi:hypothetical protein